MTSSLKYHSFVVIDVGDMQTVPLSRQLVFNNKAPADYGNEQSHVVKGDITVSIQNVPVAIMMMTTTT